MTPTQPVADTAEARVTQADREMAADHFHAGHGDARVCDAIRRGEKDDWFRVTDFARHRIAAEQQRTITDMPTIWEDPAGKGYPCFERPMTPKECSDLLSQYQMRIMELEQQRTPEGMVLVPRARLDQFIEAVFALRWVSERLLGGQQFNAYGSASNDEDDEDEDCEMILALGPIADARRIGECLGRDQSKIIEAALKFASEAMLTAAQPQEPKP